MICIVIALAVFLTLCITNYGNVGTGISDFLWANGFLPARNFFVGSWITIGSSGYYILLTVLGISLAGFFFWGTIVYKLVWQKGIKGSYNKLAKATSPSTSDKQPAPAPSPMAVSSNEEPAPVIEKEAE
jgi:hypothetical protein